MSRNTSETTKKDLAWLKLGQKVQSIIKTRKDWFAFKRYCDSYFPKCKECYDTGNERMYFGASCPNCKPKK